MVGIGVLPKSAALKEAATLGTLAQLIRYGGGLPAGPSTNLGGNYLSQRVWAPVNTEGAGPLIEAGTDRWWETVGEWIPIWNSWEAGDDPSAQRIRLGCWWPPRPLGRLDSEYLWYLLQWYRHAGNHTHTLARLNLARYERNVQKAGFMLTIGQTRAVVTSGHTRPMVMFHQSRPHGSISYQLFHHPQPSTTAPARHDLSSGQSHYY